MPIPTIFVSFVSMTPILSNSRECRVFSPGSYRSEINLLIRILFIYDSHPLKLLERICSLSLSL
eukprot:c56994_g1_i1 orf=2-190(-)